MVEPLEGAEQIDQAEQINLAERTQSRALPRSGNWMTLFFGLAVLIQVAYLMVGLASNPVFYRLVTSQSVEPKTLYGVPLTSNALVAQEAAERGLSLPGYALYRSVFNSIHALFPAVIAALIVWRARRQWFAWFTAFVLLFLGQYSLNEQIVVAGIIPLNWYGLNDIFWFLPLLFFFLFPNGKLVPSRLGRMVIGLVAYHFLIQMGTVASYFAPDFASRYHLPNWGSPVFILPVLTNFLIVLAGQVYRYRRISNAVERQQTKWFVFGLAIVIALIPVSLITGNRGGFLDDITGAALFTPIPIALVFAILRYHLWDIDVIIRRTLAYSLLTVTLALIYFAGVTFSQQVFTLASGQRSPLAVVFSTLLIAAVFNPLRIRIQAQIDRRFYRRRYDSQKTIEAFLASARQETDLETLAGDLVRVTAATLEPESISLWLRKH